MSRTIPYDEWLKTVKAKPPLVLIGATSEELVVVKAALNLLRTRSAEKHTEHPNMGWGKQANIAEELSVRIQ